jgi:hypothetical protein
MSPFRSLRPLAGLALVAALGSWSAGAQEGWENHEIKHVFVIALENHDWTQPATVPGAIEPIYLSPNAPFINSLVNGTAEVFVNGRLENISKNVAYAVAYHNVLATPSGNNPHIHPSEPNYIWEEAGTNYGILDDDDPFADTPPHSQHTTQHLSGLLQLAGKTWKSYQEDTDLQTVNGQLINLPLSEDLWTVPLVSLSGVFGPGNFLNAYNDSTQYNYACKHNPQVFFDDTNGGNNATITNPLSHNYAPLQQLAFDLAHDRVADYNWITPDQYNEMHSGLNAPFAGLTGDAENVRLGDNTVSRLVPLIMSSKAYKDGGVIVLWWDESEEDGEPNDNADNFDHTLPFIVISSLAHHNVDGLPYASPVNYSHSSDLRTFQEIFHVKASGKSPYLGDAAHANDLSDLFEPGVIPTRP